MTSALENWKVRCVGIPLAGLTGLTTLTSRDPCHKSLLFAVQANLGTFAQIVNGQAVQYKRNVKKLL